MISCPKCKKDVPEARNINTIETHGCCNLCQRKKEALESYPFVFKNVSFETYKTNNKNIKAFKFLKEFAIKNKDGSLASKGAFITGSTGTGKTHLIYSFMRQNVIHNKCFYDYVDLLYKLKKELFDSKGDISKTLDELCTRPVVFFDDFGNGKATEWVVEQMNYIINQRYINGRLTFFTTNLPLDGDNSIESNLGERIASRIFAMTNLFVIDDKDFRVEN